MSEPLPIYVVSLIRVWAFVMKSDVVSYYQHDGVLRHLVMATDLFVPPPGWKQVGMYTALNGITGKLLCRVTVSLHGILVTTPMDHFLAGCASSIAINASKPPGLLHMINRKFGKH